MGLISSKSRLFSALQNATCSGIKNDGGEVMKPYGLHRASLCAGVQLGLDAKLTRCHREKITGADLKPLVEAIIDCVQNPKFLLSKSKSGVPKHNIDAAIEVLLSMQETLSSGLTEDYLPERLFKIDIDTEIPESLRKHRLFPLYSVYPERDVLAYCLAAWSVCDSDLMEAFSPLKNADHDLRQFLQWIESADPKNNDLRALKAFIDDSQPLKKHLTKYSDRSSISMTEKYFLAPKYILRRLIAPKPGRFYHLWSIAMLKESLTIAKGRSPKGRSIGVINDINRFFWALGLDKFSCDNVSENIVIEPMTKPLSRKKINLARVAIEDPEFLLTRMQAVNRYIRHPETWI